MNWVTIVSLSIGRQSKIVDMKAIKLLLGLCFMLPVAVFAQDDRTAPADMVWNEISADEAASMPFGNGEVAGNVWVEKDGMRVYLARNDSFSELGRLMKVGRLKLSIDPCVWDFNFSQTLNFENGRILIENSYVSLTLFADSENPVVWIHGVLKSPSKVALEPEIWRTSPYYPTSSDEERHSMYSAKGFKTIPFPESADVIVPGGFYHHNDSSIFRLSVINNHIDPTVVPDPFAGRTFGVMMSSDQLRNASGGALESDGPIKEFTVKIAVTSTFGNWEEETRASLNGAGKYQKASNRTRSYWREFWDRSYLFVSTPDTISGNRITEAYNCQRWVTASAGKSDYPIKYNGSLFVLKGITPDYRRWGECYWWQNTRLPYYPLLKTGDWDILKSLFGFFQRLMPVFEAQAQAYHNASGATFPETMTQFGTFAVDDFGYGAAEPQTMWIRHIMQGPLDLVKLMLDYVRYSGDERYLTETVIPMAEEFLEFFISRNKLDDNGKMRILNTQSLETYWYGVENDAPTLAGLHAVVRDFRSLPNHIMIPISLEEKLRYFEKVLPELPLRKDSFGNDIYAPAEKYDTVKSNCENPELMAVFPFRLSSLVSNLELGKNSFNSRSFKFDHGWPQDGQTAAILGITDVARDQLLARIDNTNPDYKFPSYYGPNFDWTPDQCHGGNIMITLQEMVMQCYDDKVYLLPAFPKEWNVRFRLAAPGGNYVWGEFLSGKWYTKPKGEKETNFVLTVSH